MSDPPRTGPVIIDLEETPLPDAPAPGEAPPIEDAPGAAAGAALERAARGGGAGFGALVGAAAAAFLALVLGVWAADFLAGLFERAPWLGWLGAGLAGVLAVGLVAAALGELAALARLSRLGRLRAQAEAAHATPERAPAEAVLAGLDRLYAGREALAPAADAAARLGAEAIDGPALIAGAERIWMQAPDAAARRAVTRAARSVAATTALLPMPALDVAVILYSNARMIRRIAQIYGGRAGWLGSWRLMKAVAGHLLASGAVSASDDLLGPMLGGGVLGRLSRRFGEAAVNAALTARVGVAAIEVCRPLPFAACEAPRAASVLMSAIGAWRGQRRRDRGEGSDPRA